MGILDFREIVSPNPAHGSSKNAPIGSSNLTNDFESFCQEFFKDVMNMSIFKYASKGGDKGIDIGAEEKTDDGKTIRWLISCKHKAHSGNAVTDDEERNIIERIIAWKCDGFIPFYTTIAADTLGFYISGLENHHKKVDRYYKEKIESTLLGCAAGTQIAARYFPKSLINHYSTIIKTTNEYSEKDIQHSDNHMQIGGIKKYIAKNTKIDIDLAKKELIHHANIFATMKQHEPYFTKALCDVLTRSPDFFVKNADPCTLEDFRNIYPTWSTYDLYKASIDRESGTKGFAFTYFVAAAWSFWDWGMANSVFSEMMALREMGTEIRNLSPIEIDLILKTDEFKLAKERNKAKGLLSVGLIGMKLQEEERDIITRLFAYTNPIPSYVQE